MSESFKKFRKTGKVEDYLKYKSEVSKELGVKSEKQEKLKDTINNQKNK